ncbi:MAG: hypothetical protein EBU74_08105 [Betaproteobacteria bacterium]|nr:hypothetical protein [Betaproteobacteria bacterium]
MQTQTEQDNSQPALVIQPPTFKILQPTMCKQLQRKEDRRTFLSPAVSKTLPPQFRGFTPLRHGEQKVAMMETLVRMAVMLQERLP